ncbi:NAD(P)-dependent oxidoreductase [Mesorhizobium sp. P5_C1]
MNPQMPRSSKIEPSRFVVAVPESAILRDALDHARAMVKSAGHEVVSPRSPPEEWGDLTARVDILVLTPRGRFPVALMKKAARLRSIVFPTIGVDPLDVKAATLAGIAVGHGAPAESVYSMAEATVMLIASLMHRVAEKQTVLMNGSWREPLVLGRMLRGKTVGLVGFGRIGRAVAELLAPWQVRILVADPAVTDANLDATAVPLTNLLRESDVVSLHMTLTGASRSLIGRDELALMKPGAVIVNTSRGALIDEDALADALQAGRLGGAAVDVFAIEPLPAESRLRHCANAILTPHNAGHTVELMRALTESLIDNLHELLAGNPPRHMYNQEVAANWQGRFGSAAPKLHTTVDR